MQEVTYWENPKVASCLLEVFLCIRIDKTWKDNIPRVCKPAFSFLRLEWGWKFNSGVKECWEKEKRKGHLQEREWEVAWSSSFLHPVSSSTESAATSPPNLYKCTSTFRSLSNTHSLLPQNVETFSRKISFIWWGKSEYSTPVCPPWTSPYINPYGPNFSLCCQQPFMVRLNNMTAIPAMPWELIF